MLVEHVHAAVSRARKHPLGAVQVPHQAQLRCTHKRTKAEQLPTRSQPKAKRSAALSRPRGSAHPPAEGSAPQQHRRISRSDRCRRSTRCAVAALPEALALGARRHSSSPCCDGNVWPSSIRGQGDVPPCNMNRTHRRGRYVTGCSVPTLTAEIALPRDVTAQRVEQPH